MVITLTKGPLLFSSGVAPGSRGMLRGSFYCLLFSTPDRTSQVCLSPWRVQSTTQMSTFSPYIWLGPGALVFSSTSAQQSCFLTTRQLCSDSSYFTRIIIIIVLSHIHGHITYVSRPSFLHEPNNWTQFGVGRCFHSDFIHFVCGRRNHLYYNRHVSCHLTMCVCLSACWGDLSDLINDSEGAHRPARAVQSSFRPVPSIWQCRAVPFIYLSCRAPEVQKSFCCPFSPLNSTLHCSSNLRCVQFHSLPCHAFFFVRWKKGKSADLGLLHGIRYADPEDTKVFSLSLIGFVMAFRCYT